MDGDWMLDLPACLWNMLVNDDYTYLVWKWQPQRRKLWDTFELDPDCINVVDVEVKIPGLVTNKLLDYQHQVSWLHACGISQAARHMVTRISTCMSLSGVKILVGGEGDYR